MIIEESEDFLPFYSTNTLNESTLELLNNSCKIYDSLITKIRGLFYYNQIHVENDYKIHVIHYDEDVTIISDIDTRISSSGTKLRFRVNNKYYVSLPLEILFSTKEEISKIIDEHNKSLPIKLEERYNESRTNLLNSKERRIKYLYKDIDRKVLERVEKTEEEYNNKIKELNERYHKHE